MTGNARKRTLGLAVLLVVGTVAGFLVAAGTGGAEYATVGTIGSQSQAFQMPVEEEDQRVLFELDAHDGTAVEPQASFSLYDPADEFFTEIELAGDGDDAEVILDDTGPWILFVTERQNAELAVQYEASDGEADDIELREVPVREEETGVAEQDGGALDEQVHLRLDQRPAKAFLTFEGDVENLDAEVASEEGVVYELSDATANTTNDGTERGGDVTVTSANLAAGTYEVTAQADAFEGQLTLVHQTYQRDEVAQPQPAPDEDVEQPEVEQNTSYADEHEGTIVAEIQEGQVFEIRTAGASTIAFLAPRDVDAELAIYDDNDQFVKKVDIDHEHDHDDDWWDGDKKDDKNRSQAPNRTAHEVDLNQTGTFVVYADEVYPDEAQIGVFVPAASASADELEVETREIMLEGNEDGWNGTLEGGLLEVSAHSRDAASMDRNVTVTGEEGPVLHYEQAFNSAGMAMYTEYEVHPENFADGDYEAQTDGEGLGWETEVKLTNYVR